MRTILILSASLIVLAGGAVAQNQTTNPNCAAATGNATQGTGMGPQCEGQRPTPSTGMGNTSVATPPEGPGQSGQGGQQAGAGRAATGPGSGGGAGSASGGGAAAK